MKKILFIVLFFVLMLPVKALEDLTPNSKSAILIEPTTKTILFEKNVHEKYAPASMTKIMSMLLIMEEIDSGRLKLSDLVLISKNASSMGGSQIFLEEGSNIKVEELLKGIAIASGNDAVVALAEKIAGSESAFVDLMNNKLKILGLKDTHFANSHGLDADNHYSSAYDMAMIALELLKHPTILKYTSIYEDYFNKPDGSKTWLVNTNKLVRFYEGIDGLKTGYTTSALYCLTATGMRNNIRFISVVMGVPTTEKRSSDTVNLLSYGFNGFKLNTIIDNKEELGKVQIEKGKKEYGTLVLIDDATELLKNTEDLKKYTYNIQTYKLKAPVKNGDIVGELTIINNGKEIKKLNLTIKEDILKANYFDLLIRNLKEMTTGKIKF